MEMMCGITGFIDPSLSRQDRMEEVVLKMADAISHHGPDDKGAFVDPTHGVAFGFRRLAILDLSHRTPANGFFQWALCHHL